MSTVLITGGLGFIGAHLALRLHAQDHLVRILDCAPLPHGLPQELHGIQWIPGDVRDVETVHAALQGVEVVYHFAAKTAVDESMQVPEEYLTHNGAGMAVVARLARNRVARVILASSRAVYGEGMGHCPQCGRVALQPRRQADLQAGIWDVFCPRCHGGVQAIPCPEEMPLLPVSAYGASKRVQEEIGTLFLQDSATAFVVLRYFNVYGFSESSLHPSPGVASTFVRQTLAGNPFALFEDGNQLRDFVHLEDVTAANMLALHAPSGIYNIGTGTATTLRDLVAGIAEALKLPLCEQAWRFQRWGDIRHSLADPQKAHTRLNWQAQRQLADSIQPLVSALSR